MPFVPAGAVTGIGSLPLISATAALEAVAEFSPEIPFWPQLPQLSERESIIGQGLGIVAEHIEPRREGYGYQIKEGHIDSVLDILHRSTGDLTPESAAGFAAFEQALSLSAFDSAVAVKGQIEGPITLAAYLFHEGRRFARCRASSTPTLVGIARCSSKNSAACCWNTRIDSPTASPPPPGASPKGCPATPL
jgi:hypothetical protein